MAQVVVVAGEPGLDKMFQVVKSFKNSSVSSNPLNGFSSDSLNDELSQAWTLRECEYSSGMLRVQCYYLTRWVGSLPQVWEQSHELLLTGLLIEVRGETFS